MPNGETKALADEIKRHISQLFQEQTNMKESAAKYKERVDNHINAKTCEKAESAVKGCAAAHHPTANWLNLIPAIASILTMVAMAIGVVLFLINGG